MSPIVSKDDNIYAVVWRKRFANSSVFTAKSTAGDSDRVFPSDRDGADFPRLIILADCAEAYSAISPVHHKSICRLTIINLAYSRDSLANGLVSFIDGGTNMSDVGTKISGSGQITSASAILRYPEFHFGPRGIRNFENRPGGKF